jgi:hypothetical protein
MNRFVAAATGALLLAATPALAHHSFAMFDQTKLLAFKGVVKDFQWTNPHAVVWVVGAPKAGASPDVWTIELTSPGNLTRMGWTRKSLKVGDRVEVEIHPLRDGQHGGSLSKVTISDTGQVLSSSLAPIKPGS